MATERLEYATNGCEGSARKMECSKYGVIFYEHLVKADADSGIFHPLDFKAVPLEVRKLFGKAEAEQRARVLNYQNFMAAVLTRL